MSTDSPQPSGTSRSGSSTPDLPESLGRFRIERLLGQGGMGLVYLAHDPKKDRQIALKVMAIEKADNPTLVKRFRSEAMATRELRHENIVGVYEAGSINDQFYIALEYIDGTDVGQLIASRGRLPIQRSLEIIRQTAAALEQANARGIVHRDIKPSNLLIRRDGVVKLTDMGLARSTDDAGQSRITRAGTTVGTVDYIAPEQARDSTAADTRSDIYSLGCTWYHMLTGATVFPDGTLTEKLRHHASTPAPDPRATNDSIPKNIATVLERMLAKNPDHRFQDPTELIEALESLALNRENLSTDILAGLAEDDSSPPSTTIPSQHSRDRPNRRHAPPPSPRSHRRERRLESESVDRDGFDWTKLKPAGLLLAGLTTILVLGWFLFNLSQSFNSPDLSDEHDPVSNATRATTLPGGMLVGGRRRWLIGRTRGFGRLQRPRQSKTAAGPRTIFDLDLAPVLTDDLLADRQTQAGTTGSLGRLEDRE